MGASNSNQKSSTPDPDKKTSLENQESQQSASTKRQLPPCPPVSCAPSSCTKGECAAVCDPRETRAIPTNCGPCQPGACCGPPVYTSGQMPYFVPTQAPVCRPVVVNGEIV